MSTFRNSKRLSVRVSPIWFGLLYASVVACSVLLASNGRQCDKASDCDALGLKRLQCDAPTGVCVSGSSGSGQAGDVQGGAGGAATLTGGSGGSSSGYMLPAYTSDGATPSGIPGVRNAGKEFSVLATGLRVHDLGIWDNEGNGLQNEHAVTLFSLDQFGSPLASPVPGGSTTVPRGTIAPLEAGYRYAPLPAPIELTPGKYAVVAFGLDQSDPPGDGGGLPLPSTGVADANFDPFQFIDAASPAFPNAGDMRGHANASFRYQSESKPLKIMPLGGSISDGIKGTLAGYRGPLKNLLDTAGVLFQYVGSEIDNPGSLPREQQHHDGHPKILIASPGAGGQAGQAVQAGLYNSRVQLLGPTGSQADLILIIIGTDDVDQDNQLGTAADRLDALVTAILDPAIGFQPNAKVVLAQLPPIRDPIEDQRCVEFNKAVLSVVQIHKNLAQAITSVDLHSALTIADLADNLQPNDVGYAKIAKVFFDAIRAM